MSENLLILRPKDVKFFSVKEPESGQDISLLEYGEKIFRSHNIFFSSSRIESAKFFCQSLMNNKRRSFILLERVTEYSVWSEVQMEQASAEQQLSISRVQVPNRYQFVYTQTCLLIVQAISDDIEDLMGTKKKNAFQEEVIKIFKQCLLPGTESNESINYLLTTNPIAATQLPIWEQEHMDIFFPRLCRLGKKYFGNTSFVELAVETIKDLPIYNHLQCMKCCMQFILSGKT